MQHDICISLKALPKDITIGKLNDLVKSVNSLFNSDVISLKCINGASPLLTTNSNDAPSAQDLINEMKQSNDK